MPDRRLEVFHAAASQMSFTRAAELLQMTQPAVTFQIKQLEEHFGTRLFERAHGRVSLTPEGVKVKDYADRILDLFASLENELQAMATDLRGHLLIGATPTVAEYHLPPVLAEFRIAHPNVVPRLTVDNPDVIEPNMKDEIGEIELQNCGFKKFSKDDSEANSEKVARFNVEMYVEKMIFKLNYFDSTK